MYIKKSIRFINPKNLKKQGVIVMHINIIREEDNYPENISRETIINFLYNHLGEFGDTKKAISKSIDYAFSRDKGKGGFLVLAIDKNKLIGAVVMNKTGMHDYIPEYFLVYIAIHKEFRGKGFGSKLLKKIFDICDGDVALHVEYENPAKRLYERLGFTSKYAEMRHKK